MFEDLVKNEIELGLKCDRSKRFETIQSGEYKSTPDEEKNIKLFAWLYHNYLFSLLQTNETQT